MLLLSDTRNFFFSYYMYIMILPSEKIYFAKVLLLKFCDCIVPVPYFAIQLLTNVRILKIMSLVFFLLYNILSLFEAAKIWASFLQSEIFTQCPTRLSFIETNQKFNAQFVREVQAWDKVLSPKYHIYYMLIL